MPALLLEVSELRSLLAQQNEFEIILVDLGKQDRFSSQHIPGAVLVTPAETQAAPPIPGFCPSKEQLTRLMQGIGLNKDSHVVVYDDEGGGWAGRFIWLLDEIGHKNYSYLNGGINAWLDQGFDVESGPSTQIASAIEVTQNHEHSVSLEEVMSELNNGDIQIWDARSPKEYNGETVYTARGGHIPGAINYEWTNAMDKQNSLRLKPLSILEAELKAAGIIKNKATITHCQTHHRSGLTYLVAKIMGFTSIKAYPGSWGEWGNQPNTPINQTPSVN